MKNRNDAEDIYNEMYSILNTFEMANSELAHKLAIKCSLAAINKASSIAMTGYFLNDDKVANFQVKMRDYYQELKQEIEKL